MPMMWRPERLRGELELTGVLYELANYGYGDAWCGNLSGFHRGAVVLTNVTLQLCEKWTRHAGVTLRGVRTDFDGVKGRDGKAHAILFYHSDHTVMADYFPSASEARRVHLEGCVDWGEDYHEKGDEHDD